MNYTKIAIFILLTFGLSWIGLYIPGLFLEPESLGNVILQLLFYSWGPAAATLLTQKFVFKESMARYGWNRKRYSFSWILITMIAPILILLGTLGTVFLMGNVFHIPGFGQVILGQEVSNGLISNFTVLSAFQHNLLDTEFIQYLLNAWNHVQIPPEIWTIMGIVLVIGIIAGASFNLLFNVGEEVGWRGFMVAETRQLGFLGSNLIIGGLYGLWQIPLVLHFIPELSTEVFWVGLTTMGFAISVSFPMAYISLKTRSIYASATFIGVLNNISSLSLFFIVQGNIYLSSVKGFAGMMFLMFLTFLIIRFDEKFVRNYQDLRY